MFKRKESVLQEILNTNMNPKYKKFSRFHTKKMKEKENGFFFILPKNFHSIIFFAFIRSHFSTFFSFFVELDEILRMKLCES